MDYQKLYRAIWDLFVFTLDKEVHKPGQSVPIVAKNLGRSPSTIYRWLDRTRGEDNLGLREVLQVLTTLGVDTKMVIETVAPDKAEMLFFLMSQDEGMIDDLFKIAAKGGQDFDKIKAEIEYVSSKLNTA